MERGAACLSGSLQQWWTMCGSDGRCEEVFLWPPCLTECDCSSPHCLLSAALAVANWLSSWMTLFDALHFDKGGFFPSQIILCCSLGRTTDLLVFGSKFYGGFFFYSMFWCFRLEMFGCGGQKRSKVCVLVSGICWCKCVPSVCVPAWPTSCLWYSSHLSAKPMLTPTDWAWQHLDRWHTPTNMYTEHTNTTLAFHDGGMKLLLWCLWWILSKFFPSRLPTTSN